VTQEFLTHSWLIRDSSLTRSWLFVTHANTVVTLARASAGGTIYRPLLPMHKHTHTHTHTHTYLCATTTRASTVPLPPPSPSTLVWCEEGLGVRCGSEELGVERAAVTSRTSLVCSCINHSIVLYSLCEQWRIHVRDMTHSYVRHDAFMCEPSYVNVHVGVCVCVYVYVFLHQPLDCTVQFEWDMTHSWLRSHM